MDLFEEYAMLVSNGNADLRRNIYGEYDDPAVITLQAEFVRKVKAQVFRAFDEKVPEGLPEVCYQKAHWWDGRNLQRRIVCAANRFEMKDGGTLVIPGSRHYSKDMSAVLDELRDDVVNDHVHGENQGFIDQWGNYFNREDAYVIAYHSGQIDTVRKKGETSKDLYSEDLY